MGHVQTKEEQIEARKKDRHNDGKQRQSGRHKHGTRKAVAWASLKCMAEQKVVDLEKKLPRYLTNN